MYKVLILGGKGMLGQMVYRFLSKQKHFVIKKTHHTKSAKSIIYNIENGNENLRRILDEKPSYDYIINCIGVLNNSIDREDIKSVHRAIRINTLFPHDLSILAQEYNIRVIQISTDAVFDRSNGICFEDSLSDCHDLYASTKYLGEVFSSNYLNLRCSIIGPSPYSNKGLLNWFLSQPKGASVLGFKDQKWKGVTTVQFSNLCKILITNNYFDVVHGESGIHHFCPNNSISKYNLLKLFKSHFRDDINVIPHLNQKNAITRLLKTKYKSIHEKFGNNLSMKNAIDELAFEMKNK